MSRSERELIRGGRSQGEDKNDQRGREGQNIGVGFRKVFKGRVDSNGG